MVPRRRNWSHSASALNHVRHQPWTSPDPLLLHTILQPGLSLPCSNHCSWVNPSLLASFRYIGSKVLGKLSRFLHLRASFRNSVLLVFHPYKVIMCLQDSASAMISGFGNSKYLNLLVTFLLDDRSAAVGICEARRRLDKHLDVL